MVTLLSANYILFFVLIICFTFFPALFASGFETVVLVIIGIIVLVPVVILFVWVGWYYRIRGYELREDEMSWRQAVWFRTTGIVRYTRIMTLDVRQGPVMRVPGISMPAVQTAGYSGQTVPEIRIEGMEHAEELHELIRSLVCQPGIGGEGIGGVPARILAVAVTTDQKIPDEPVKILQLLGIWRK